jgi:predicted methyltransferase
MKSKLLLAAAASLALSAGMAYAKPSPEIVAAVADKGRPEADTKRDADRKPAEMLEFAGVKPGQTVVDLIPGGGYFTRVFSKAVGPKGVVYAVGGPPRPVTDPAKPPPPPAADVIAADANYANTKSLHVPLAGGLSIPTKADLVWTSQNYHDVKNVPNIDMLAFNKSIFNALKPGGTYVVLDHVANSDAVNPTSTLHRIDPAVVKKEVLEAGFKFVGESTVLRNPSDDHAKGVFDGAVRSHTDQFIYKFQRPK